MRAGGRPPVNAAAPGAEEAGRLGPQGLGGGTALGPLVSHFEAPGLWERKVLSPEFLVIHYTSPKK